MPRQARDKHNDESWLKQSGSMSCVCSLSSLCLSYVGLPPYLRGLGDAWRDDLDGGRARRLQVGRALVSETHTLLPSVFAFSFRFVRSLSWYISIAFENVHYGKIVGAENQRRVFFSLGVLLGTTTRCTAPATGGPRKARRHDASTSMIRWFARVGT